MAEWIFFEKSSQFDLEKSFIIKNRINWEQNVNININDIVYVYLSEPINSIKYKCKVNKINLSFAEIDDNEYFISENNNDKKYIELELISTLKGTLFERKFLELHNFNISNEPIIANFKLITYFNLIEKLQKADELDPDSHDGSYELVRKTIDEYAKMKDLSDIDYKDLDLVYLMTIGTWKQSVNNKKKKIKDSNLPNKSKDLICDLLDEIWTKANNDEYSNKDDNGNPSIGMFGTGFFTFKRNNNDDNESSRAFIQMLIDISIMTNENNILKRCSETLSDRIKGMKSASASVILHCLKPTVFPVFNSNMGNENIFKYLGVKMRKEEKLSTYIDNVRQVKSMRDDNFKIKNYRIFDLAARLIGEENDETQPTLKEVTIKVNQDSQPNINHPKIEYDKNMILYGPPGTGKTYSTAIYAVAICENKPLDEVKNMDYNDVIGCYNKLKSDGRIAFTTFHQSYGYEEFIEGIRPVLGKSKSENLEYKIESGVFKKFCEAARKTNRDNDFTGKIWAIRSRAGDHDIDFDYTDYLYAKGVVMVESIEDDKRQCNLFNRIEKDDIVILGRENKLYAFGVVTDSKPTKIDCGPFHWQRKVKWNKINIDKDFSDIGSPEICVSNFAVAQSKINVKNLYQLLDIDEPYVFIIDEINRGNISKIFGELITLIEETKREGTNEQMSSILPYSGKPFSVPSNVYIIGTMNTADRSIALMDTALRRRFQFVEMMPNTDILRNIGADHIDDLDVAKMLDVINERITFLYDREHTIGHALFTKLKDNPNIETLASIFRKSVMPLLQEYFYEDYQKIQLVLGDNGKTESSHKFIIDEKVKVKSIFKGYVDDVVDLPEYKYTINESAFMNLEAYKEII